MKEYPKGAIKSINELLEFKHQVVFECDIDRSILKAIVFTGEIGLTTNNMYYWKYKNIVDNNVGTHSLMDYNIIENDYNTLYLFSNVEDAREAIGKCRHCGK